MSDYYYSFDEYAFRNNVKKALKKVETILEADRRPLLAEDVQHNYENKYELANHMTNISIVAQMNVLERLGFTSQIIQQLVNDSKKAKKTTTLRFQANETCTFLKEQTVDVPDPHAVETVKAEKSTFGSTRFESKSSTIRKVIRKVKEYHWTITTHWEITAFKGTDVDQKIMIQSRDSSTIVITQSKDAPMEKVENHTPVDLNLTWLLDQVDLEQKATTFTIDTSQAKTPRRNEQVEASLNFFASGMKGWLNNTMDHFLETLQHIIKIHNPAISLPSHLEQFSKQCSADDVFLPILPLLEELDNGKSGKNEATVPPTSVSTLAIPNCSQEVVGGDQQAHKSQLLSGKDTIELLNAQAQSIDTKLKSLNQTFPPSHQAMTVFSIAEASLYTLLDHSEKICLQYKHSIGYLEKMLEQQLVSAIGKRVTNKDLEEFVQFHNAKFLTIPPKPFCHAIGRPKRFPYGVLSIEKKTDSNNSDNTVPIDTLMRPVIMSVPLEVPLNAATSLQLTGNTYLHGWLRHRSEKGEGTHDSFQLSARARQFSSFLLAIGTMAGPHKMNPKDAIILQNKDEVLIPLLLEEIPSAKEFKNAIESLSPEQQQFAKAFRGMQLESSVFGVAVIQIKPQLEALLGLPEDSLSKEIKLTEDLMELFVEHQVPSDLLSFDDNGIADDMTSPNQKVDSVRQNVKAVMDVIDETKEKQLEKALMEEEARKVVEKARAEEVASASDWLKSNTDVDKELASSFKKVDNVLTRNSASESSAVGGFGSALEWLRKRQYMKASSDPDVCAMPKSDEEYRAEQMSSALDWLRSNDADMSIGSELGSIGSGYGEVGTFLKAGEPGDSQPPPSALDWLRSQAATNEGGMEGIDSTSAETRVRDMNNAKLVDVDQADDGTGEDVTREESNEQNDDTQEPGRVSPIKQQSVDFTKIPKILDATIERFDKDSILRSTKLKASDTWSRKRQPDLLTKPTTSTLYSLDVKSESNKAYDLLDAISRSGSLPIAYSDLHVVVCVTHCFEKDIMATVVEDNVNPIEKLEMSTVLLGSAVHGSKPLELIAEASDIVRLQSSFPVMLEEE